MSRLHEPQSTLYVLSTTPITAKFTDYVFVHPPSSCLSKHRVVICKSVIIYDSSFTSTYNSTTFISGHVLRCKQTSTHANNIHHFHPVSVTYPWINVAATVCCRVTKLSIPDSMTLQNKWPPFDFHDCVGRYCSTQRRAMCLYK